jgi:hypothetical protein
MNNRKLLLKGLETKIKAPTDLVSGEVSLLRFKDVALLISFKFSYLSLPSNWNYTILPMPSSRPFLFVN